MLQSDDGDWQARNPSFAVGNDEPQMKIAMVHNRYREPGGEDVVFESEQRLLQKAGHQVVPYVRSNAELPDASLLDRIGSASGMVWSSKSRHEFSALLQSERPDIVHIHNTFMAISPSIYSACSEHGVPVVQTLHNFRLLCPAGNFFRDGVICHECLDLGLQRSVRHACYRGSRPATAAVALMVATHRALHTWRRSITRFITLTEFARAQFVAAGFPAERFVVKPNFSDCDPGKRGGRGEYGVFIGRLVDNKGVHVLLDAWRKLPEQYPLQIVGEGPEEAALKDKARDCNLGISFRGRLSRDAVLDTIKGARFIVVPSTLFEGFPMCIVEAFACGTPVLCSKLGGLAEIVRDGVTGLHFNPGDADGLASTVDWAWDHVSELVEMGHNARREYEVKYTAERAYSLLREIYEQALRSSVSRGSTEARPRGLEFESDWQSQVD